MGWDGAVRHDMVRQCIALQDTVLWTAIWRGMRVKYNRVCGGVDRFLYGMRWVLTQQWRRFVGQYGELRYGVGRYSTWHVTRYSNYRCTRTSMGVSISCSLNKQCARYYTRRLYPPPRVQYPTLYRRRGASAPRTRAPQNAQKFPSSCDSLSPLR